MSLRSLSAVFIAALAFALTACPKPLDKPDGNDVVFDGGNPAPRDACSGGCADNQVCDVARKTCVDGCGGCDGGTCVKTNDGTFACRVQAVACGGNLCEPGQVACMGGECACLSSLAGALDTCRSAGKWCNGRVCQGPKALEQCNPGPTANCAPGFVCNPLFGADLAVCARSCSGDLGCDVGEACASNAGSNVCIATGLFRNQECEQVKVEADGGLAIDAGVRVRLTVTVGNTCLLKDNTGVPNDVVDQIKGSGTCTNALFKFWNQGLYPFATCRPPGQATEGAPCRDLYTRGTAATQCGTGLQCSKTKGGDEGVCLRTCNAQPPALGFSPQPECHTDEACVNSMRYTDPNSNAVLGMCMKKCNVFDPAGSSCANVGATPASCIPTEASGELAVTNNGDGICAPQRAGLGTLGQTCTESDPFKGAACPSGQVCTSLNPDLPASCTAVCDLDCAVSDGGTGPARCATEPNARCATGTCRRVSTTTGSRVGFCL